jgi:hypothetical protein
MKYDGANDGDKLTMDTEDEVEVEDKGVVTDVAVVENRIGVEVRVVFEVDRSVVEGKVIGEVRDEGVVGIDLQ